MEQEVEKLIYLFIMICIALIGFNFVCIFWFRLRDRLILRKAKEFTEVPTEEELSQMVITEANLLSIEKAMDVLLLNDSESASLFAERLKKYFFDLISEEKIRDPLERAYVMYLSVKYSLFCHTSDRKLTDVLVRLATDEDFYVRENALKLIYNIGDEDTLIDTLKAIDRKKINHNEKLLHDGMLEYTGDAQSLHDRLWRLYDSFSDRMQAMLLKYFRFSTDRDGEKCIQLLKDPKRYCEVHYGCLHYLDHYCYEPARPLLLWLAETRNERNWEYAAITADALSFFPGKDTCDVLKKMLQDRHWYVRSNAAKSLLELEPDKTYFDDIMTGDDQFAKEAVAYRIDKAELTKEKKHES